MSTTLRPKLSKNYSDDFDDPLDDYAVRKQFLKNECGSKDFDPTPKRDIRKGTYTTLKQFEEPSAIKEAVDYAKCANVSHENAIGIGNFFLKGAGRKDLQICPSTSTNILHESDNK